MLSTVNANKTHSVFSQNENKGILDNVSLYGNMRNISNSVISTVTPILTESGKVKQVNSYMTINALDAIQAEQTVKSTIKDKIKSAESSGLSLTEVSSY